LPCSKEKQPSILPFFFGQNLKMRKFKTWVFALFLIFILTTFAAPPRRGPVTGDSKKAQLFNLARDQSDYVVELNDGTYDFYMTETPRPYSVVVLFTANHPRYKCTVCKSTVSEFRVMASSYAMSLSGGMQGDEIFFVVVDIDSSRGVFEKYKFTTVPQLFVVPPSGSQEPPYQVNPKRSFMMDSQPDAEKMAKFVQSQLGVHITITRSITKVVIMLIVLFGGLALLIKPVINRLDFFLGLIRKKVLWMFVSLGLYTTSISGMIYDIIRNPPPFFLNHQTGQIVFFHPQSNQQFVIEGFIIGFLNVGCAVALICLCTFMKRFKDSQNRSTFIGACFTTFVILLYSIISLYRVKNRWYMRV